MRSSVPPILHFLSIIIHQMGKIVHLCRLFPWQRKPVVEKRPKRQRRIRWFSQHLHLGLDCRWYPIAYVERFHLSPTPRISVGIHRTADSVSAPRAFHPRQDLCFSAAPIACDGFAPQGTYHARTVAGQEYHYPYCLSSPYRELPGTYSRLFSLHIRQDRPQTVQSIRWRSRCRFPGTSWRNR